MARRRMFSLDVVDTQITALTAFRTLSLQSMIFRRSTTLQAQRQKKRLPRFPAA